MGGSIVRQASRRIKAPILALLALGAWLLAPLGAQTAAPAEATFESRVDALGLEQRLNGEILNRTRATLTPEKWCGDHHLAPDPIIVAKRVRSVDKPATADQRARLGVGAREDIRYRRVQLTCGP